jgi:hypothetical protein
MMTRTKLALGTAAAVTALAACRTSAVTPRTHAGQLPHGVQQAQSDARDVANAKREHMNTLLSGQAPRQDAPWHDELADIAKVKRHLLPGVAERAGGR